MTKPNQKTRALFEKAKRYMPYGVNSNFRYWGDEHTPIMQRGMGAYVWDADDNRFQPFAAERLHGLVNLPFARVAQRLVEQILPVLHIDDGVAPLGLGGVGGRQVHIEPAPVMELRAVHRVGGAQVANDCVLHAVVGVAIPMRIHERCVVTIFKNEPHQLYHVPASEKLTRA